MRRSFLKALAGMVSVGTIPKVRSIEAIRPQPGEVYVLTFARPITQHTQAKVREAWLGAWDGVKAPSLLILDQDVRLSVMKEPKG